jgi:hypothetical protein
MTKDEHKKLHQDLHKSLDEICADYIVHNRDKLISETSVIELMKWSYGQTIDPDDDIYV